MQIHDTAFIAPGAVVLGDVTIGENSGIWHNAVVRGDRDSIVIGKESNIQDNAVVYLGSGYPVESEKLTHLRRGSTGREKSTVLAEVLFCKLHVLYQFQRSQILLLLIPDGIISH